ncbi:hypothetical protein BIS09_16915, partial [Halomonas sp. R1t8]|uniref:hypothetical protein n=1 Tax=unclassified Halomonas TaxID=2609666 RepID=UPI00209F4293
NGLAKANLHGRRIKKCSLAVIGKVSAPASRIQEDIKPAAYRLHADSTWSSKTPEEKQKMLANSMKWISIYHEKRGRKDMAKYYANKAAL